ncbi:MAG: DUF58 domain-containing protein [Acidimicrobiales bacterium]
MTVKPQLYLGLVGGLLFAAVVLGRAELVVLATPFAVALVVGLGLVEPPVLRTDVALTPQRMLEGEPVSVEVRVESATAIPRLEVAVGLSEWVRPADGRRVRTVAASPETPVVVQVELDVARWGAHWVGPIAWRAHDVAGFCVFEGVAEERRPLRVYPRRETLRALVPPAETQVFVGNRRARARGEGTEFAELRPFVPGDRVREVNWRVAARGGGLWVNERHPERNSDVVVFVDTFAEALLDRTIRAAAALIDGYGATRDRVGLVDFGGSLRWVQPGVGVGHLYRIADALIDTQVFASYVWRGIRTVPPRTLPAKALVLALTPLDDDRMLAALADLRSRGIDLAVVEIVPTVAPATLRTITDQLGYRAWVLDREVRRSQFRRLGVPVVEWTEQRPLSAVMEEVSAFRRRAPRRVG